MVLTTLSLGVFTACGKMAIDGEVVDAAGSPVVGARIGAVGSLCEAHTDDAGKFAFECTPGPYDLSITMPGYIGEAVPTVQATERKRYDVGRRLLVKVPEQEG
ncbi:carboxypeptidase-like regulatory domain-containing protein, partial [Myxococcota bacterium]|nr:carboxypeptidase-like regulatory domain-containing protein [Myxococcota bacterium]